METIQTILKIAFIVLDVGVLATLLFTILSAITKGTGKFIYKSFIKWALVAVYILVFSKMIATVLMGIEINGQSITEILGGFVSQALSISAEELATSEIMTLVNSLAIAIIRAVVIFVGVILILFVVYPILKIFFRLFGIKKLLCDKEEVSKASRGVAVIFAVLVCVVKISWGFGPLYGLATTATQIVDDVSLIGEMAAEPELKTTSALDELDLSGIKESIQSSVIVKVLSKADYNISQQYLDFITKTETDNGDIKLIREYTSIRKIFPAVVEAKDKLESIDINSLFELDFETLLGIFEDNEAIKVLFPAIGDTISRIPEVKTAIGYDFTSSINWKDEYVNFNNLIKAIKKIYTDAKQAESIESFVVSETANKDAKDLITAITNFNLIVNLEPFIQSKINELGNSEGPTQLLKYVDVHSVLHTDSVKLVNIAQNAYKVFLMEEFNVLNLKDTQVDALTDILEDVFSFSFFKGHEDEIIKTLCSSLVGDQFDVNKYDFSEIDWENEPAKLGTIFKKASFIISEFDVPEGETPNYLDIISNCDATKRDELIVALKASDLVNKVLFPIVDEKVKAILNDKGFSVLADKVNFTDMSADTLKADFAHVFGILDGISQVKTEEGLKLDNPDALKPLLHHIFDLSFVQGSEADLFEFALQYTGLRDALTSFGISVKTTGIDWDKEIDNICQFMADYSASGLNPAEMTNIASALTKDNKELIKAVLNDILALQTLQNSFPSMIDSAIDQCGMGSEWKSQWLAQQLITFVETEWDGEVDNLIEVLILLNNTEIVFSSISSDDLSELTPILHAMIKVKSFSTDGIVRVINEELRDACGTTTNYLSANSMTKDDWEADIDKIFAVGGIFDSFTTFSQTESNMYKRYGQLLDKMLDTKLFASGFYTFLSDYIKTMSIYQSASNPNGVLTATDISLENLQSVTSWETELGIMDSVNLSGGEQSGAALDLAMKSVFLKDKIKGYLVDIIASNGLTDICPDATVDAGIAAMNTKLENEPTYSWAQEVANIQAFSDAYTSFTTLPLVTAPEVQQQAATSMKNAAEASVFASLMLSNFLNDNPSLAPLFA